MKIVFLYNKRGKKEPNINIVENSINNTIVLLTSDTRIITIYLKEKYFIRNWVGYTSKTLLKHINMFFDKYLKKEYKKKLPFTIETWNNIKSNKKIKYK